VNEEVRRFIVIYAGLLAFLLLVALAFVLYMEFRW
jgi:hypothetical protein